MMECYAKKGDPKQVLSLFNDVKTDKQVNVDNRIYYNTMNACSHSGLVDDTLSIFENYINVKGKYNINPQILAALIDCLGTKGGHYLDEAENLYTKCLEPNINLHYKMKNHSLFTLIIIIMSYS